MIGRRLGLLALGAAVLAVWGLKGRWAEPEVSFTRAAPPTAAGLDLRPAVSTLHLTVPVDLERVARRADAAIEQRLAMGLGSEPVDPSCAKRPQTAECVAVRIDGTVTQAGPASVMLRGSIVRIAVPMKIEPIARPADAAQTGADKEVAPRGPQQLTIGFSYAVRSAPGGGFVVSRSEDAASDAGGSAAQARTSRQLEGRLRQVQLAVQDELQQTMARVPVAIATQRAWTALSQPIQLGLGSGAVLTANPEIAGTGELMADGNRASVRIPISVRLAIGPADGTIASPQRPLINGVVAAGGEARIRMAVPIRLDVLQQSVSAGLIKAGAIETRPDRFGPPVKVVVHGVRAYPAARQIAFELDATATRFEGQSFRGKAHLAGRPVLDAERAVVSVADITFPPLPPRDLANPQLPANAPRLASEPFAGMLAAVGRIDINREVADIVPQAMNLLQQRLGDRLTMAAKLGRQQLVGIETARDSVWLVSDIPGELSLVYDGPHEIAAAPGTAGAGARSSAGSGVNLPEAATAAVVSAAALSSAAAVKAPAAVVSPLPAVQPAASEAEPRRKAVVVKPDVRRPGAVAEAQAAETNPNTTKAPPRKTAGSAAKKSTTSARRDWIPFSGN